MDVKSVTVRQLAEAGKKIVVIERSPNEYGDIGWLVVAGQAHSDRDYEAIRTRADAMAEADVMASEQGSGYAEGSDWI